MISARAGCQSGMELLKRHFITKGSLSGMPATVSNCPRRNVGDAEQDLEERQLYPDSPRTLLGYPEERDPQQSPRQCWLWCDPTHPTTSASPQFMADPKSAHLIPL